jgi:hypothetical protein
MRDEGEGEGKGKDRNKVQSTSKYKGVSSVSVRCVCCKTPQCLRLKACIFAVPSFFLDSEIKTTKLFIYTCFHNVLC